MSDVQDGWWTATNERATFTFLIRDGKVKTAPPYGWSLLGRKTAERGIDDLLKAGFTLYAPEFAEAEA